MPIETKRYIHRIGRTARAGKEGKAISICDEEERKELKKIVKKHKDILLKHTIKTKAMEEISAKVEESEGYLHEVEKQEGLEKQYFLANIEIAKAENIVKFKDQIMNRPKRFFFVV